MQQQHLVPPPFSFPALQQPQLFVLDAVASVAASAWLNSVVQAFFKFAKVMTRFVPQLLLTLICNIGRAIFVAHNAAVRTIVSGACTVIGCSSLSAMRSSCGSLISFHFGSLLSSSARHG